MASASSLANADRQVALKAIHHQQQQQQKQKQQSSVSTSEVGLKAKLNNRKRTKTGCLTCRKRRIKCGEERPVCKNCTKSKRHCEGYHQRVVFKSPAFDPRAFQNDGHFVFRTGGSGPQPAVPYQHPYMSAPSDPSSALYLTPRPLEQFAIGTHAVDQQVYPATMQSVPVIHPNAVMPASIMNPYSTAVPVQYHHLVPDQNAVFQNRMEQGPILHTSQEGVASSASMNALVAQDYNPYPSNQWLSQEPSQAIYEPQLPAAAPPPASDQLSPLSATSSATIAPSLHPHSTEYVATDLETDEYFLGFNGSTEVLLQQQLTAASTQHQQIQDQAVLSALTDPYLSFPSHGFSQQSVFLPAPTTTEQLTEAAVEVQDDDYYDVDSDEEVEMESLLISPRDLERRRALNKVLSTVGSSLQLSSVAPEQGDSFIHGGVLNRYKVDEVANPLRNPATARIFAYFIFVTGPSLSVMNRHLLNNAALFVEERVPLSQQGLWTYKMPMAALHHQGLLHAMLALSSLHIARLQGASTTPSMQHYAWALKRIHSSVSSHTKKRLQLTTIAATMLLGFYEVMTADHMKWNTHLAGSKQLFIETDFVGMMQQYKRMKMERTARRKGKSAKWAQTNHDKLQSEQLDQIPHVDEAVLSQLTGREVQYLETPDVRASKKHIPPPLDLSQFEALKDLYWWYLKQDAYQSIVSGNELLLNYRNWTNCTPRSPLGDATAVYGTFDHLVLLLGRVAEFSATDRKRKLKVMESNGGQWKPVGGMKIPRPPTQQQGAPPPTPLSASNTRSSQTSTTPSPAFKSPSPPKPSQGPQGPQFYGMAPPPRDNVQMPSSYRPAGEIPATPLSADGLPHALDIESSTQSALEEYGRIRAALFLFAQSLGEAFQPLGRDLHPSVETAFGSALLYRSWDIACVWATYNMAVIIAIRSHPHMHPAAHVAAALAAHETAPFAREIGQIAGGLVLPPPGQPLNPVAGAALCESCMPSFFAGVQYQSARQRESTVMRMYSIALRTGWGSAELMANGCETAWVKAAAAGRGPPYERVVRPEFSDDPRLNGRWETLDPQGVPDVKDERDRRLVTRNPSARLNWAIGIMGTEDDEQIQESGARGR